MRPHLHGRLFLVQRSRIAVKFDIIGMTYATPDSASVALASLMIRSKRVPYLHTAILLSRRPSPLPESCRSKCLHVFLPKLCCCSKNEKTQKPSCHSRHELQYFVDGTGRRKLMIETSKAVMMRNAIVKRSSNDLSIRIFAAAGCAVVGVGFEEDAWLLFWRLAKRCRLWT
ncbi:hypothetical protein KC340_g48 [Hortaea werneckii]|nr:hypothetical protein KC340_g48 [Hortaea werneckii]